MTSTKGQQALRAQEEFFELVKHSDALGTQCQETSTDLTDMERKMRELEKKLEDEIEKAKVLGVFCVIVAMLWQ